MRVSPISKVIAVKPPSTNNIYSSYERQRKFLQRAIQNAKTNDSLSPRDKQDRIDYLEKKLNTLGYRVINKPLQDFIQAGKRLTNKLDNPMLATRSNLQKVSTIMDYGLISSSIQLNMIEELNNMRNKNNEESLNRINSMQEDSQKAANVSTKIASKAAGLYAEIGEAILINEAKKKINANDNKKIEKDKKSTDTLDEKDSINKKDKDETKVEINPTENVKDFEDNKIERIENTEINTSEIQINNTMMFF